MKRRKKLHTGTIPKYNRKIVETGEKGDTSNIHLHDNSMLL